MTDTAPLADTDHEFELPIDGAVAETPQWADHTRHGRAGVLVAISDGLDAAASGPVRQIGDTLQHFDNCGSTRGQAPGVSSSLPGAVIVPTYSRNGGRSSNSLRRTPGALKRERTGTTEATEPTALTNKSVTKARSGRTLPLTGADPT